MENFKPPITCIEHPLRDCAYKEAEICLINKRGGTGLIMSQIEEYSKRGFPKNWGLIQSGILMRERTVEVIQLCQEWWREVLTFSKRDQISFAYCSWPKKIYHSIKYDYRKGIEFIYKTHHKKSA